jgi:hypothetical protein
MTMEGPDLGNSGLSILIQVNGMEEEGEIPAIQTCTMYSQFILDQGAVGHEERLDT